MVEIVDYLNRVETAINKLGFVKADVNSGDMPTWEVALSIDNDNNKHSIVNEALSWIRSNTENDIYFTNLKNSCSKDYLEYGELPLAASLIQTYKNKIKHDKFNEDVDTLSKTSNYVGNVGEKLVFDIVSTKQKIFERYYPGGKINSMMYNMVDSNGNNLIWYTDCGVLSKPEKVVGTIKKHQEYGGVKQTILTRVKQIA